MALPPEVRGHHPGYDPPDVDHRAEGPVLLPQPEGELPEDREVVPAVGGEEDDLPEAGADQALGGLIDVPGEGVHADGDGAREVLVGV